MKALLTALLLTLAAAATADAQTIDGDWQGTLAAGPTEIRVVLHFTPDSKGGWTATLDSPDQGAKGIPISAARVSGSTLTFDVPPLAGTYEGKIAADGTAITGTWSQSGMSIPLKLSRPPAQSMAARVPKPSDIDGTWNGTLEAGGAALRIVIHILSFEDGMTAAMDSPDQNLFGAPASAITRNGTRVTFEMKQLAGRFSGVLDATLATITGTWSQLGNDLPLLLTRAR